MNTNQSEEEFEGDNDTSFLDTLVSQETRRRPNQPQPLIGYIYSPRCMRGSGLAIGVLTLLFAVVLLSISFSDAIKSNSSGDPTPDPNISFKNKLPLWVLDNININRIKSNVQYLSSDLLEGRYPATRGGNLTTMFIQSIYQSSSISPMGDNGTYYQNVPLYITTKRTNLTSMQFINNQNQILGLIYLNDFVADTQLTQSDVVSVDGANVVFVGFGISSLQMKRDDYKGVSVAGKIVVSLVGAPSTFNTSAASYYGRQGYKMQVASRLGARGIIFIHTDSPISPWSLVQSSALNERSSLNETRATSNPTALTLVATVTEAAANSIIQLNGGPNNVDTYRQLSQPDTFTPMDMGMTMSLDMLYSSDVRVSQNVVGGIVGAKRPSEVVVVMSHHDHLGMRVNPDNNISIFHGAVDDASGVAVVLELANILGLYANIATTNTFSQVGLLAPPERTILFVCTTAEESGLLGAQHFLNKLSANKSITIVSVINYDGANVLGETDDIVSVGLGLSPTFDSYIAASAKDENMSVSIDPMPQNLLLYRNDALVFLEKDIPAIMISMGTKFRGQNASYYIDTITNYFQYVYHTPADIVKPEYTFKGTVQQIRITARVLNYLANTNYIPLLLPNQYWDEK